MWKLMLGPLGGVCVTEFSEDSFRELSVQEKMLIVFYSEF